MSIKQLAHTAPGVNLRETWYLCPIKDSAFYCQDQQLASTETDKHHDWQPFQNKESDFNNQMYSF